MDCPICGAKVPVGALVCPVCGTPLDLNSSFQALPVGAVVGGKYQIDKVLGQGGFGITYAATQTQLGFKVAVKEMFPSGSLRQGQTVQPPPSLSGQPWQQAKADFTAEARVLARFNYPNIVRVVDLFEQNGTAYMVMELLQGESLQARIERLGPLPAAEVQQLAVRITEALKEIHAAGLLHRDIKPDNIFLEASGRTVLIDFGSARDYAAGQTVSHTRLVTPGYAPLEQYGNSAKFGPYTDIYALGATLYHALSGKMPPSATDLMSGVALPPLPANAPAGLRAAITQAMSVRVADRPQSAEATLQLLSNSLTVAAPVSRSQPLNQNQPAVRPMPRPAQPQPIEPQPVAPQPAPLNKPPVNRPRRRGFPVWPLIVVAALLGTQAFRSLNQATSTHSTDQGQAIPETTDSASTSAPDMSQSTAPTPDIPAAPGASDTSPTSTVAPSAPDDRTAEQTPPVPSDPPPSQETPSATEPHSNTTGTPPGTSPHQTSPFSITAPAANAEVASGAVELKGTGQPNEELQILQDGQPAGNVTVAADGQWTFKVPSIGAGAHQYIVMGSDQTEKGRLNLTVLAPVVLTPAPSASTPAAPSSTAIEDSGPDGEAAPNDSDTDGALNDSEIKSFIDQYLIAEVQPTPADSMKMYADQVNYLDQGTVSKTVIEQDKQKYFGRWPQRRYALTSGISTISSTASEREIRFEYSYELSSTAKTLSGKAYSVLKLVKTGGQLYITSEKGTTYPGQKSSAPAPESLPGSGAATTHSSDTTTGAESTGGTSAQAPAFSKGYFTSCQDTETGQISLSLQAGRRQNCQLNIETVPNGAQAVSATFTYQLNYQENANAQTVNVDSADHWSRSTTNPDGVTYKQQGNTLVFNLPLAVKNQSERPYSSIDVTAEITFDNGSSKTVTERLSIE